MNCFTLTEKGLEDGIALEDGEVRMRKECKDGRRRIVARWTPLTGSRIEGGRLLDVPSPNFLLAVRVPRSGSRERLQVVGPGQVVSYVRRGQAEGEFESFAADFRTTPPAFLHFPTIGELAAFLFPSA